MGDVTVRVDVAEVAAGAVGGVAAGAAGRLISAGVGEAAGFAVAGDAVRAIGAFAAAGLADRPRSHLERRGKIDTTLREEKAFAGGLEFVSHDFEDGVT